MDPWLRLRRSRPLQLKLRKIPIALPSRKDKLPAYFQRYQGNFGHWWTEKLELLMDVRDVRKCNASEKPVAETRNWHSMLSETYV
jgi:hypothetical protein